MTWPALVPSCMLFWLVGLMHSLPWMPLLSCSLIPGVLLLQGVAVCPAGRDAEDGGHPWDGTESHQTGRRHGQLTAGQQ